MRLSSFFARVSTLIATLVTTTTQSTQAAWQLKSDHQFNGAKLDTEVWKPQETPASAPTSFKCWDPDNVYLQGGFLVLQTSDTNIPPQCRRAPFTSATVYHATYSQSNAGRWVMRVCTPTEANANGKPYTYGKNLYGGIFPAARNWAFEHDIFEQPGSKIFPDILQTQHWGGNTPQGDKYEALRVKGIRPGCHTHELQIIPARKPRPAQVSWFIDGVRTQTQSVRAPLIDARVVFGFNTRECGSWVDCPANARANGFPNPRPSKLRIDYVKIYAYRAGKAAVPEAKANPKIGVAGSSKHKIFRFPR
jgi:hypothetical protein